MSKTYNAKQFSKIMRELARVPAQSSRDVARDINREIQRNFDRGVDPYGKPWRKLAKSTLENGRHPPPLTDSRDGRKSVRVSAMAGAGIQIVVGVLYMLYHQFGGASHLRGPGNNARQRYKNRKKHPDFGRDKDRSSGRESPPRRSFLPFDRLPPAWGEIILGRLEQNARRVLNRG